MTEKSASGFEKAAFFMSVVALIVSGVSAYYAREQAAYVRLQADAARETNARTAGRIPAMLALVDSIPNADSLPNEMRRPVFGTDLTTAYFDDPEKRVGLNPRIVLKNIGEEPIEAIKVTVAYDRGFTAKDDFKAVGKQMSKKPIILEQVHVEEYPLDRKCNKGEVIVVPITEGLMSQMLQGQREQTQDAETYGAFAIRAYGKIVGASSYDDTVEDSVLWMRLLWLPKGFEEEKCKKIIENFQPRVEVMKTADKDH